MDFNKSKKANLILANGMVFEGKSFGATGTVIGEMVFSTSMTGYQENLSDPAYAGQILMQTFPLIGNYGVNEDDFECDLEKIKISGYVVREECEEPSNFRCLERLNTFLENHNIVGLYDLDTRRITRVLRENGVMNVMITCEDFILEETLIKINDFKEKDYTTDLSVKNKKEYLIENPIFNVAVIDFGYKYDLYRKLNEFGCNVIIYPYNIKAEELMNMKPDGIIISSGSGNPHNNIEATIEIKKLLQLQIPLFGISLGHQLMALAAGGQVEKLKYGHRGANQPVMNLENDMTYITSQNHGYSVVSESITNEIGKITHINANDKTCEGIKYNNPHAFSVQFYPEVQGGINDTSYLYSNFILLMNEYNGRKISSFI